MRQESDIVHLTIIRTLSKTAAAGETVFSFIDEQILDMKGRT
ncbi:hypothetical protein ACRZK7_005050 [Klebsiella oxytoca]|nr:hypothetical protein [Klebsiella oxytoca]MCW9476747.1 hypothetical protein [Klebsiella oxytoca]MCW9493216.1 hypothetical protein [Klebsiella oxytoca]MDM4086412.1 hypothetical protein [Klebsiella oxytoca]SBL37792.1 Uncharacterised protein [Klebsiella oxytoca]SBL48698.1 Uncharacterised protein [Klebsiella oxytoca]